MKTRTYDILNAGPRNRFMAGGRIVSNSSRGVQLHNLPRGGSLTDPLMALRDILDGATAEEIDLIHGPALVVASELLRPAFVAAPGHLMVRGDYSQIEARVNPWLAGGIWKLDAFRQYDTIIDQHGKKLIRGGPDLYRVTAAKVCGMLFGKRITVEEVTDQQRQAYGKVPELALGFQGGKGAFQAMARAYGVKVTDHQAESIKVAWREANPEIEGLWRGLNHSAIECMSRPAGDDIVVWTRDKENRPMAKTAVTFRRSKAAMVMRLPSKHPVFYWTPRLRDRPTPWGTMQPAVIYRAEDAITKQWHEFTGYGGLFCENAVQAGARDIMAAGLVRLDDAGLDPRLTVHDEAVCMVPRSRSNDPAALVSDILCEMEPWMAGLPIAADASAGERYVKG